MNHQPKTRFTLPFLVLVLGSVPMGCLSATASVPEVEVTRENLTFPGIPEDLPTELPDNIPEAVRERFALPFPDETYHFPTLSFTYDRVTLDLSTGITSKLYVREVTLKSHEGSTGLGFVRGILLRSNKPNEPLTEAKVLLQYPTPGASVTPLDRSLTLDFRGSLDAINPWKGDPSIYTLDVWADLSQLPRQSWSVDVVLVLSGSIEFEF